MSKKTEVAQLAEHSRSICEQYLDGQPYDRLRLVNEARFCLAQSAEAMLEAGKRLLVIKESEPHGDYQLIVERDLGLDIKTCQRMMAAAVKFLSPKLAGKGQQFALLGKSKLYELMLEDDDDLAALADGGTVAGLELDEIERMSCRELKKALRAARDDNAAKDAVLADKAAKIAKLETAKKKLKALPPDEESQALREEGHLLGYQVEALIRGQLRPALQQIIDHAREHGVIVEEWVRGELNQIDTALLELRAEIGMERQLDTLVPWEQPA